MPRPPFSILKAAFWLLALLLGAQMLATMGVVASCAWAVLIERTAPFGACQQAGELVRSVWSEALAAVLALLLAARGNGK
jgi:hypothetical protein